MSGSLKDYKLNDKQVRVLKLIYKFRFVTAPLLARYRNDSYRSVANSTLERLTAKGYLGRHYDKSYKFQFKGARYYLAPRAQKLLRDEYGLNQQVLHAIYRDKTANQKFIDERLEVFKIFLAIRDSYPGVFHIFSKSEIHSTDYFPESLPDLYLSRVKPSEDKPNDYLLEYTANKPLFVLKKRFLAYVEHFDSNDWEAQTENKYPGLLFVCDNSTIEAKLLEHIEKVLDSTGIDDLEIRTTTLKALNNPLTSSRGVWSAPTQPNILVSL
ncbi:MAG TPA: replication-relaxation family protein [Candidatus Saccharimonadales bacterium]|jgi:hypothetical protein|nr:replication-relaxation family protein [Candidatus Saccharimonadales bacterium]